MASNGITSKRVLIDKANSSLVAMTAVAAFITVFSLVASKALFSQLTYQNRVLKEKHATVARLRSDLTAGQQLATSYKAFTTTVTNAIGGDPNGAGQQDGNNTKIILDALPSNYDFPALATSIEQLITSTNGLKINSINGTDDEVAQSANATSSTPTAIPMPFTLTVEGNYQAIQDFVGKLEHSIRPFQVQTATISGDQSDLKLDLTAQTFYQPAKKLTIGTKVVK
ncbi:MAG TPA: type 4a pilus biogenesis protein PilO [Candidatus Microsaccharimonas sp.]|nr:type 4a pilus biogenesis protein PilO [Candidatus Microsaccharimonas sp.]